MGVLYDLCDLLIFRTIIIIITVTTIIISIAWYDRFGFESLASDVDNCFQVGASDRHPCRR